MLKITTPMEELKERAENQQNVRKRVNKIHHTTATHTSAMERNRRAAPASKWEAKSTLVLSGKTKVITQEKVRKDCAKK